MSPVTEEFTLVRYLRGECRVVGRVPRSDCFRSQSWAKVMGFAVKTVDDYRLAHKNRTRCGTCTAAGGPRTMASLTSLAVRCGSFELRAVLTISEFGRPVLYSVEGQRSSAGARSKFVRPNACQILR